MLFLALKKVIKKVHVQMDNEWPTVDYADNHVPDPHHYYHHNHFRHHITMSANKSRLKLKKV